MRRIPIYILLIFVCSACQNSDPTTGPAWAGVPRPSGAEARRITELYWYDPDGYEAYLATNYPQVLENDRRLAEAKAARDARPSNAPAIVAAAESEWTPPPAPVETTIIESYDPPPPVVVAVNEPEPWTEPARPVEPEPWTAPEPARTIEPEPWIEPAPLPAPAPVAEPMTETKPIEVRIDEPNEYIEVLPSPPPTEHFEIAQSRVASFKGIPARERSRPGTQAVWAWAAGVQMALHTKGIQVHPEYIVASNYDGMVKVPDFRTADLSEKLRIRAPGGKITVKSTARRSPMNPLEIVETIDRGQIIMVVFGPEHPSGRPVHPIIVYGYRIDAFGETNLQTYDPWPSVAKTYEARLSAVTPHWRETILIEGSR